MKALWEGITLMKYATDEDDGRITADKWLATVAVALIATGAWLIALAIVRG